MLKGRTLFVGLYIVETHIKYVLRIIVEVILFVYLENPPATINTSLKSSPQKRPIHSNSLEKMSLFARSFLTASSRKIWSFNGKRPSPYSRKEPDCGIIYLLC